jgi:hypothetical protein
MKSTLTTRMLLMSTLLASTMSAQTAKELFDSYDTFKRPEITSRRFTQAEMLRWIGTVSKSGTIKAQPLGQSAEGRTISLYTFGAGATKVLLWSQMHGDEPTATMALMDIFSFLAQRPDHEITRLIQSKLTLLVIPMLNPDGAERFTRRTAQLIDMNRDAAALTTPEANILRNAQKQLQPQFGFNLHDQDPRYSVGQTTKVAAIALLAPATDEKRGDNAVRARAKKVAAGFARTLEQFIPGHVAKYDDTYEPRAFGDRVQQWGTSTVLVESGGWPNDREKMFLRKLNCVGILTSLVSIAAADFEQNDLSAYESLPFNTKNLYDLIVRGIEFKGEKNAPTLKADIAFNLDEQFDPATRSIRLIGKVVDLGDLSTYGAFEERTGTGIVLNSKQIQLERAIPWEELQTLLKVR